MLQISIISFVYLHFFKYLSALCWRPRPILLFVLIISRVCQPVGDVLFDFLLVGIHHRIEV